MAYEKIPPKTYPPYKTNSDKRWDEINKNKEMSMLKLNCANGAYQIIAAEIHAGIFKPATREELLTEFTRLHGDLVNFLTMS